MPKIKTHKGAKKRFRVSANGKVSHKRAGSSHLMSHKSGKQVRRLRKKPFLKINAEAHRFRRALQQHEGAVPEVEKSEHSPEATGKTEPGAAESSA
ncbi:MAG TPA: 50S ribosomal protein L35 [Isosphaeraceae bacterium]|jgi:large subunit ribosomal protein L35|nr:50S ribosomal protein L35 [Isosphaeraceae bacterium]